MKTISASFYYQNDKPNGFACTLDSESVGNKQFKVMMKKFEDGCKAAQTQFSSFEALKQLESKILEIRKSPSIEAYAEFIFHMGLLIERKVIKQDNFNGSIFKSTN